MSDSKPAGSRLKRAMQKLKLTEPDKGLLNAFERLTGGQGRQKEKSTKPGD